MSQMSAHSRTSAPRTPGLAAAWAVLIGTGLTSVTYNVVHAVQGAHLEVVLALLLAWAPAFVAACLSHLAAVLDAPWPVKTAVIAVTLAGMVLSASATASVVAPAEPGWRGWLFGITLDAAALLALWAILTGRRRKNEAATEVETAREAVAQARSEAQAATQKATETEADLATAKTELETVRASLEAEVQALTSALNRARNNRRGSGRKRARSSAPNTRTASPQNTQPSEDIDTQAEALSILLAEPDISGGELGRRLGKSERYGCMLKNRLAASMAGPETQQ